MLVCSRVCERARLCARVCGRACVCAHVCVRSCVCACCESERVCAGAGRVRSLQVGLDQYR